MNESPEKHTGTSGESQQEKTDRPDDRTDLNNDQGTSQGPSAGTSDGTSQEWSKMSPLEIGERLFQLRDYTPVPLILLMWVVAKPTVLSATLGMLVITAGELIRLYAVSFIGGVSRTRTSSTNQHLVTDGAFSIVRNPLYVGNFLITTGIALYTGQPWLVLLAAALFGFQYYYVVIYEESLLTKKFGDEYESYKKQVPPWIPTKVPQLAELPWPETFGPAIKSEKRTATAIAIVLLILMLRA